MSPLHLVPRPARILSDEIAAIDAGYPPGIRDIARREAERLKASGDTITSLAGRAK